MIRKRTFTVNGINLRVHTKHTKTEYVNLWRNFFKIKKHYTYASNALMIGTVNDKNVGKTNEISGYFYRFLDIDLNNPWFDINKRKKAEKKDLHKVKIPSQLRPNLVEIPYIFDVKKHKLYFVSHEAISDLSPTLVFRLLRLLSSHSEIEEIFGHVNLTVLSERKKVEEMLSWPILRKIELKIERPNPSEEDDEREFYEGLKRRGAESEVRILTKAHDSETLIVDEELKKLANIASNNGSVEVSGFDKNRKSGTASSKDFPMTLKGSYDPKSQLLIDALKELVTPHKTGKGI